MPGRFTDLDVRDPHLIGQAVRDSLPLSEKTSITDASAMEWAPLEGRFPAKWSGVPRLRYCCGLPERRAKTHPERLRYAGRAPLEPSGRQSGLRSRKTSRLRTSYFRPDVAVSDARRHAEQSSFWGQRK